MEKLISELDLELYSRGMRYAASLSRLFSTSPTPLVDSRFAEKIFCASTGAKDLSRSDMSFDALYDLDAGVGVKTFIAASPTSAKFEKVAEFTKLGPSLAGLSATELAMEVARLRNLRVMSDASQYGINLARSFYHCLIRVPGKMFAHEEPYELINMENIGSIEEKAGSVSFTDGKNQYRFSRSKTVLLKKFDLGTFMNTEPIETPVNDEIWQKILKPMGNSNLATTSSTISSTSEDVAEDFVVLPLYAFSKSKGKYVAEKSGINQWNAGGRKRKFGEAYIPVPSAVHQRRVGFFPPRDVKFRLRLPDGVVVSAKLCQDGSKALMSDPNEIICKWLFATLDGSFEIASDRINERRPYSYEDLLAIGRDSVRIVKRVGANWDYEIELAEVDEFENFIESVEGE